MAGWLTARGHQVRVVTAPPFYPEWRVGKNFSAWKYRKEETFLFLPDGSSAVARGDITVYRCPLWVPVKPSGLKRLLHYVSFALCSFPVMLLQVLWRPDVVLVVEPTIVCAPQAWLVARLSGAWAWLHIQDMEVDAAFEMGLLPSGLLSQLAYAVERVVLARFDSVSTISASMLTRLKKKGVADGLLFPNWVDTEVIRPMAAPSLFRRKLGLSDGVRVALYSGNMGNKQGLEILVAAARLLQGRGDVRFVFCGDGSGREGLVVAAAGLGNASFMPLQPIERLNDLLNLADIHLLPQKADAADLVMPSKLTGMLASGRPVVATAKAGTQLAEIVENKGIVVEPDDAGALASAIGLLADDEPLRRKLGAAARTYAVAHLGKQAILTEFEKSLLELVSERRRAAGQP